MAVLTVGPGGPYKTIAQGVAASKSGDTVSVQPGTYVNDFLAIKHSLLLEAPGGARIVATVPAPDGKAIITEGAAGISVTISGFDISGAKVKDANGAAIRYEGGHLTLKNVTIHHNQNGLLAASDPAGTIEISNATFHKNGTGTGATHNIYVNRIAKLTIDASTVTGAVVGHQVKSRAASTTVTNSTIGDGDGGNASYEIDLPNGGIGAIANNIIHKGPAAQNPSAIAFGAEGNLHGVSTLTVQGNTIVNTFPSPSAAVVRNFSAAPVKVTANALFGWVHVVNGPGSASGNTTLGANPLAGGLPPAGPPIEPPPVAAPPVEPPAAPPPVVAPPIATPPIATPPVPTPPPVPPPPVDRPPVARPRAEPPPSSPPSRGADEDGATVEVPPSPSRPVFTRSPAAAPATPAEERPAAQPLPPAALPAPSLDDAALLPGTLPPPVPDGRLPEPPPGAAPVPGLRPDSLDWTSDAALPIPGQTAL